MIDKDTFYTKLGERIKKARTDASLTLDMLNANSGLDLSKGSFSAMENGKQQISAYQLYCISKALNIPIETLVGENKKELDIPEEDIKKINEQ